MTDLAATDELFFTRTGLDRNRVTRIVEDALKGADDGELYLEYSQSEGLVFDNGRPDVMVPRNHPGLRAYAAVGFQGAGMFQAFWVADGRILGAATEYAMVDQATANEYQPLQ